MDQNVVGTETGSNGGVFRRDLLEKVGYEVEGLGLQACGEERVEGLDRAGAVKGGELAEGSDRVVGEFGGTVEGEEAEGKTLTAEVRELLLVFEDGADAVGAVYGGEAVDGGGVDVMGGAEAGVGGGGGVES